ncbi:MAG: hypothetical protein K6E41_00800 [Solobacterium sp.]|nr:hypothetical protein [Solobacterium sp.]
MTSKHALRICRIISAVLVIVFAVKSAFDYLQYSPVDNSAPFGTWILANAVCCLVPAAVLFIISIAVHKKGYTG